MAFEIFDPQFAHFPFDFIDIFKLFKFALCNRFPNEPKKFDLSPNPL